MDQVDRITEINRNDLPLLKKLYTPDGKKSYIGYTTIETYIRWFEKDPRISDIAFYCLNGDFSRGTFVVIVSTRVEVFSEHVYEKTLIWQDHHTNTAYADALSENTDELLRLLLLIDYSKGYFFISITDHAASAVKEAIKQKNVELYVDESNLLYYLPKEKALEFSAQ